ncbi:MAG: endopeptidase La [Bacteroidetes bacterium]|nr:MAG: endopeptidase La [Bacteroidota bacterium]
MFEQFIVASGLDEESEFLPFMNMDQEEEEKARQADIPAELPVLALKNTVLFPNNVIPITVGRDKSIEAINSAYQHDRLVAVVSQRDPEVEDPGKEDLYGVGTVAYILKLLKMPDGTLTAILQGRHRCAVEAIVQQEPFLRAQVRKLEYESIGEPLEFKALVSSIHDLSQRIIELSPNIPSEAAMVLRNITSGSFLLNFIASNINAPVSWKQKVLEENNLKEKGNIIIVQLNKELQLLELKDQIETKVRSDIEKQQRDYFLNQQLKTIQEELGGGPQQQEIEALEARAAEKDWPERAQTAFARELDRLRRLNPQMPDYSVQLNYLEFMLDLPWNETTPDKFDLKKVRKVLDRDHFGLEKVKTRILEHLAVLKLKGDMKAPILCLVGPPGVGKTSLGRSIADALGRKFVRMSLGGLHDESEIRGHRRTYIGAMPGRILQSLKKAKAANPVFILDEIDKVGNSFRGDPSSALLEVLDPEQNSSFHDNYLDVDYDLSKIMFIATANNLNTIQAALLDRMEVIHISGYSLEEKVEIAKRHLIPKQRENHGLQAKQVKLGVPTIKALIQGYTRESGVRTLNRQIASVMRYVAKSVALEEDYDPHIKVSDLHTILGPARFSREAYQKIDVPGVAIGLAWTSVGGEILFVEGSLSPGKGKLTLTGNLGDVMKESAVTALSFLKAHAEQLQLDVTRFDQYDVHLHVPEGAIPKDGPSAGITMLTTLYSLFSGKKVRPYLAMTGEITLRGKVLPVGGIKEKILAAKRAGMKEIILCQDNKKDVDEIETDYLKGLTFHYVERMEEVLDLAIAK